MRIRSSIGSRGDTIVEVMICIAIIGGVLAGAYATANISLRNVRSAQEHEEAISLAQSQLESLSAQTPATLGVGGTLKTDFCFTQPPSPALTTNAASCTNIGGESLYTVNITSNAYLIPATHNLPTYTVDVHWPALGGGTNDVQLYYQSLNTEN